MAKEKVTKSASIWRRLGPALGFMASLLLLVAFFYGEDNSITSSSVTNSTKSSSHTATARYNVAKKVFEQLKKQNSVEQKQWHSLAQEFYDIYTEYKSWPNRPAALFRNAMVLERIAKQDSDFNLPIERYIKLATEFKTSLLADDALLQAAIIYNTKLNKPDKSLQLIDYIKAELPKGDMYNKAVTLESKLRPSNAVSKNRLKSHQGQSNNKSEKHNASAALTQVSWATLDENTVQITIALDKHVTWRVDTAKDQQVLLIMDDTAPAKGVQKGARVKNSVLTQLAISQQKHGSTNLKLNFAKDSDYKTKVEQNPFRIVLTATAKAKPKIQKVKPSTAPKENTKAIAKVKAQEKKQTTKPHNKSVKPVAKAKSDLKGQQSTKSKSDKPPQTAIKRAVTPKSSNNQTVAKAQHKPKPIVKPAAVPSEKELSKRMHKSNTKDMALQLGLSVQTVFIDIGHGGRDPGAIGNGIVERDIVLDVGLRLGKMLKAYGLDVIYSRTTDQSIALSARPAKANKAQADLFVSIHVNANKDISVHGFETYYLNFAKNAHAAQTAALENSTSDRKLGDIQSLLANVMLNVRTSESIGLASDVLDATIKQLKRNGFNTKNSGTRSAPFHVLIDTNMPAILVEVGYCSNKNEAAKLKQPKYRAILAKGIAEGIMQYKNRLEKGQDPHFALTNNDDDAM